MTRDRREWEDPYGGDRQSRGNREREDRQREQGGARRPYQAFGGLDLRDRMQGPRERGGWQGGPYETGGFQGGGGYAREEDRQGFDIESSGGYRGAEGYRGDFERGGYHGAEGYRGDFDRGGYAGRRPSYTEREGRQGLQPPGSRGGGDYRQPGGQYQPSWGESWGMEEQSGWRGPGEMPGYRTARTARPQFDQGTTGGQIPGEFRNWSRGPHSGRGPRNYRRSDERILGELCDRLTADSEVDASDIEVEVKEGKAILSGAVPDRWMKHRAEDLAESVLGIQDVDNRLRVRRGEGSEGDRRPAQTAPTRPGGHNTVLHADAPELLGSPTAKGEETRGEGGEPAKH